MSMLGPDHLLSRLWLKSSTYIAVQQMSISNLEVDFLAILFSDEWLFEMTADEFRCLC